MDPQKRIEATFEKVSEELDSAYLRKMQGKMHRCAADCCEDSTLRSKDLRICIESCTSKLSNTEQYITREFNTLQKRLQRCVQDCNDDARSKLGPNPTELQVRQHTAYFEKCAESCVDKLEKEVPIFVKNIKTFVEMKKS